MRTERGGGRAGSRGDDLTDAPRAHRRVVRRVVWPLALTALVVVTLALGVFPTRTYLEKKQQVALTQHQVDDLIRENDEKQARIDELQTDAEIEAIARGEYNLVKPGEESYVVRPLPKEPVELPESWPFDQLSSDLEPMHR